MALEVILGKISLSINNICIQVFYYVQVTQVFNNSMLHASSVQVQYVPIVIHVILRCGVYQYIDILAERGKVYT